ncbi:MAG: hypothetical protein ACRD3J_12005, partial [Thermoanaerobaculia bacterium]
PAEPPRMVRERYDGDSLPSVLIAPSRQCVALGFRAVARSVDALDLRNIQLTHEVHEPGRLA